ncbi:MAG: glycoside hydrolase family 2 [Bacteroides sp.]|nr:glycoside hydrolase family 2 [Bacteroides sp.]
MKTLGKIGWLALCLGFAQTGVAQDMWKNDFSNQEEVLNTVGRGECRIVDGVFRSKGSFARFGNPEWKDYTLSFKARAPKDAEQVQIWAGFRTHNRFDRYVVGIKGGLQDDLYLMRTGYMGTDEFMGVRPLGFHPVPGEWYKIKVEVCGDRIRVFVEDNELPHIDLVDKNASLAPTGEVALGGGWIETEFDDLTVTPLSADALQGVKVEEYNQLKTPQEKEQIRQAERAAYKPILVTALKGARTEISLDGNWLFMPEYQLGDKNKATATSTDDTDWHVMSVPNFWNPIRIWLHGETMPSPTGQQHKGVSDTYYQRETDRCENYTFDYRKTGAAWYRQWIELPEEIDGKQLTLDFDAVSKLAEVYINGQLAATHVGMFGNFSVDATKYLQPGKNLLVVKVTRDIQGAAAQTSDAMENYYSSVRRDVTENKDDKQANKEVLTDVPHGFYGGNPAGIWQPVKLTVTQPLKIEDVFIKPALDGATFDVTVKNHADKKKKYAVQADIVDKQTGETLYSGVLGDKLQLNGGEEQTQTYSVDGLQPKLWEPATPHLYDFKFTLVEGKGKQADLLCITSGFRTFESKDGFFYLNGRKYWLRGGNHIPAALCPNDVQVADRFMQLMREGNINSTRTHTTPWNELWVSAADRNGIAISFEGTWSWLMIHSTPIPDKGVLDLWSKEWLQVMKKFKNHPSIFFWTVNNEMKFYDLDADKERAMQKFRIISDVVKDMRKLDPTRPMCFDSNYMRRNGVRRFGQEFIDTVDDGDIDDNHGYYNWYDYSVFRFFNGEFQKQFKTPGRPLISQEMSTGYPNAETGHPTRSYQLIHQNPYSLIGYEAYDWGNPAAFLKVQSFITGELAETLRRTNDEAAGIMHFAYMTWVRQCYDAKNVSPYPTYYAMQRAMQPVLVSAELWGRNLYAGEKLTTRIYVVNDSEDGRDLQPMTLKWKLVDGADRLLAQGTEAFPAVAYYGRKYIEPAIQIPTLLPADKINAKLKLELVEAGKTLSVNEYDLVLATPQWNQEQVAKDKKILVLDKDGIADKLNFLQVDYQLVSSVKELVEAKKKADLCIVSGLTACTETEKEQLRTYQAKGGRLLLLNSKEVAKEVYPEYITGWIIPTEGDIVVMERNDASVFKDIDILELRYFNNNEREIPLACTATLKTVRHEQVKELASQMKIHAYIDGGKPEDRIKRIESMRGLTLLQITDGKGVATVSTMCTEKADTDPIAGKLLVNMINDLLKQ